MALPSQMFQNLELAKSDEYQASRKEREAQETKATGMTWDQFLDKKLAEAGKTREWFGKGKRGQHGHDFGKEDENKLAQSLEHRFKTEWDAMLREAGPDSKSSQRSDRFAEMANRYDSVINGMNQTGNQLRGMLGTGINSFNQSLEARQRMMDQLSAYQNSPLTAPMMMRQGTDQAARNAIAMGKGGGRMGPSAGAALEGNQAAAAQSNQQVSLMGAQEQLARQQFLTQGYAGLRQQDLATAGMGIGAGQAGVGMLANAANVGVQADMLRASPEEQAWAMQQQQNGMMNAAYANQVNAMLGSQMNTAGSQVDAGIGTIMSPITTAASAIASIYGASDRDLKKNIKKEDKNIDEFLNKLSPASYEYNNKATGPYSAPAGTNVGIMAQDAKKSKLGKEMVKEINGDLVIDKDKMASLNMAASARLAERIQQLESKLGQAGKQGEADVQQAAGAPQMRFGQGQVSHPIRFGQGTVEPAIRVGEGVVSRPAPMSAEQAAQGYTAEAEDEIKRRMGEYLMMLQGGAR